jgi:hypothetical protein
MRILSMIALVVVAFGFGACAKQEPAPAAPATGYSK